jgi:type IV secretory pathway VirB10-like protein
MAPIANSVALLAILVAALPAQAQSRQPAAGNIYCCNGGRICGDSLPEQCRGKAYRILDKGGNVIKDVPPPLTPEEKAQAAAAEQKRKEEEAAAKEQKRKDAALLQTYTSLADIDRAQSRSETEVRAAIKGAEDKIAVAQKKRKKYEEEAEFYKKKAMPPELSKGIVDADGEIKTQQELLAVKQGDLKNIQGKYDGDRKRYMELTGAKKPPPEPVPTAPAPR